MQEIEKIKIVGYSYVFCKNSIYSEECKNCQQTCYPSHSPSEKRGLIFLEKGLVINVPFFPICQYGWEDGCKRYQGKLQDSPPYRVMEGYAGNESILSKFTILKEEIKST